MQNKATKKNYTIFLSLVFIGIGGYKLYQKFGLDQDLPTYQWILAAGLVVLGVYQLASIFLRKSG
ncbi:MAG: hypothetical protein WBG46_13080 [Nonlabens sp.]